MFKLSSRNIFTQLQLCKNLSTNVSGTKEIDVIVSSLRIDRILATGLAIGRRKVEYDLLSGIIKLNGATVTKKSIELKVGDVVDRIIVENSSETNFTLGRVHLKDVHETTKKGNFRVTLLRTKVLEILKSEYEKQFT